MNKTISMIEKIEKYIGEYYKIRNHHILINPYQVSAGMDAYINDAVDVHSKKVHIILTEWDNEHAIAVKSIIDTIHTDQNPDKCIIHIPTFAKDIIKLIERDIDTNKYRIVIEGQGYIKFNIDEDTSWKIYYYINHTDIVIESLIYAKETLRSTRINLLTYFRPNNYGFEGVFSSVYRRNNPELYKEEIIKDFKKETPDGILASFKDDNDIWNYILGVEEWEESVSMKNEDGSIYNGSFEDQMKAIISELVSDGEENENV